MRKILLLLVVLTAFIAAPTTSAHRAAPPGHGGECTTSVHAGDPDNPAHERGVATASDRSPAIEPGAC
jgi:hypothetical protein